MLPRLVLFCLSICSPSDPPTWAIRFPKVEIAEVPRVKPHESWRAPNIQFKKHTRHLVAYYMWTAFSVVLRITTLPRFRSRKGSQIANHMDISDMLSDCWQNFQILMRFLLCKNEMPEIFDLSLTISWLVLLQRPTLSHFADVNAALVNESSGLLWPNVLTVTWPRLSCFIWAVNTILKRFTNSGERALMASLCLQIRDPVRHSGSLTSNICLHVSHCQYYTDRINRRAMTKSSSSNSNWQRRHLVSAMQKYGASSGESMGIRWWDKKNNLLQGCVSHQTS
jgi:hypothetical protein